MLVDKWKTVHIGLLPFSSTYVKLCGRLWGRSCVSSMNASHLRFFQKILKNRKILTNTTGLWLEPITLNLDSLKCCIFTSTLRPLDAISTLLGPAYPLFQVKVVPRQKLGKRGVKAKFTCWKSVEIPSVNSSLWSLCGTCGFWSITSGVLCCITVLCYLLKYRLYCNEIHHFLKLLTHLITTLGL